MKVITVLLMLGSYAFAQLVDHGKLKSASAKKVKAKKGKSLSPIICPTFPLFGGPGMYCLDSRNLYNCMGPGQKAPKAVSNCVNGCVPQPPGHNDICSVSPSCGQNEMFTPCFSSTCWEGTCANPVVGPQCSMDCKTGCRCRNGFVRDSKGNCVAHHHCSAMSAPQCPENYHGYAGPGLYCLKNNLHFCQFPGQKKPQLASMCQWGCYLSGPSQPDSCVEAPYGVVPQMQKMQQQQIEMQMQRMYMQQLIMNQLSQQSHQQQYHQPSLPQYILPQRQIIQPQSHYHPQTSTLPSLSSRQNIFNQLSCPPGHRLVGNLCL